MRLTDEEQRMYDGGGGPIVARAMDYLVKFGEACDSDRMIDIGYAHVYPGEAHHFNAIDKILELAESGARVVVPTSTTNIGTDMEQWRLTGAPEEFARRQESVDPAHKKMGIACTYSCTPYLMGYIPPKGMHIASIESSAVIYFNSVLGARTNRDGTFAIYAALTGKYPVCGYHLTENRKGTHLVHVNTKLRGTTDYGALGFCIGDRVGGGVPVIIGLVSPTQEELISMGSAMATSGQVALYHIPKVTAECQAIEDVLPEGISYAEFSINGNDIRNVYEKLNTATTDLTDFVFIGCPHSTLDQIREAARLIEGKKVNGNVMFWVLTNRATKAVADRSGYTDTILRAGGLVVCDFCPLSSHFRKVIRRQYNLCLPAVNNMVTNSVKQAKYANDTIGCTTILNKLEDCINAAVTGKGARQDDGRDHNKV